MSNYTSTLDILERLLSSLSLSYLRLDGKTPAIKRQELVDRFNRTPPSKVFAFLLSAKSGGTGLNLIGASRLILFDVDWNPSTDLQAMARIHRDGQKMPCKIYRLLLSGGMDEKIWQRQITKMGLADQVVDGKGGVSLFSREDLKDLFRLDERTTGCQTHELLGCGCEGRGIIEPETSSLDLSGTGMSSPREPDEDEHAITENNDSDNDEGCPELPILLKVSQLTPEDINPPPPAEKRERAKKGMRALMQYAHIDTALLRDDSTGSGASLLEDDDVLLNVLKDQEVADRVAYVFAKTSS